MEQLTKGDFFNANWPAPVRVELPHLSREVYVRILTVAEIESLSKDGDGSSQMPGRASRIISLCACDKAGVRVFTDDDAHEIGRRPVTHAEAIFAAAHKANRLDPDSAEEERKNSSPAPT